jgi:16S rRNA (cytidine1402-2'-O)-methyltransferase
MTKGNLYLIPVPLAKNDPDETLPTNLKALVASLSIFVVENAKTARQWLKWYGHPEELRRLTILEMKPSDGREELVSYLAALQEGKHVGVMSEAGCPGVADPGAKLVRLAHQSGIRVIPLVGSSSILLALMASGLNGQRFAFHGYLPVERNERNSAIAALEQRSRLAQETQIFIETPYRNSALFRALIDTCHSQTLLCIATDLTDENETVATHSIGEWRKQIPDLEKRPSVFLVLAT